MRIGLVIAHYNNVGGGAERWTDRHARDLLARGHEVHLVARSFRGAPEGAVAHGVGSDVDRLGFADAAAAFVRSKLAGAVIVDMGDGHEADVFLPHHGTRAGTFRQNTRLVPPLLRWTRPLAHGLLPRYREFATLEARRYRHPSAVFIALSNWVAADMRRYHGVAPDRIRVVPNGVDVAAFHPATSSEEIAERERLRREWGFADRIVALLVAHNFRLKGLDHLLTAVGRQVKAGRPVALVVAGQGDVAKYRRLAEAAGGGEWTRFLGDRPDPLPIYQAADIYAQPTYYDPCSLVALEALACGLPVVTTRHNGAGELLRQGVQGIMLDEPDDVAGLAAAFDRFADPKARLDAGRAARALAEVHSQERNTADLLAIYAGLKTSAPL